MSTKPHTLEALLSPAEFDPYRGAAGGDPSRTLELYDWNAQVGTAFAESLHYLEVGLRTNLEAAASEHLGEGWLTPHSALLSRRSRHLVDAALRRAGATASRREVIAELPFGFWVELLGEAHAPSLWSPALRFAFDESLRRTDLHVELEQLLALHDLIAHHQPLYARNLLLDYDRVLKVARSIGPALEEHLILTSRVPEVVYCQPSLN